VGDCRFLAEKGRGIGAIVLFGATPLGRVVRVDWLNLTLGLLLLEDVMGNVVCVVFVDCGERLLTPVAHAFIVLVLWRLGTQIEFDGFKRKNA
jgi:hypothetical protein